MELRYQARLQYYICQQQNRVSVHAFRKLIGTFESKAFNALFYYADMNLILKPCYFSAFSAELQNLKM